MKKISIANPEKEVEYIRRIKVFPNEVVVAHKDSVQEGFAYFESEMYSKNYSKYGSSFADKFLGVGFPDIFKLIGIFAKYMKSMFYHRNKSFGDVESYLTELEQQGSITRGDNTLVDTYPNSDLWETFRNYAWDKWKVKIGFTQLPTQLVFEGKAVLFKYAIVCYQEMNKDKIDRAPTLVAGEEVQRVYNSLGIAVNDLADCLRNNYRIKCQSNHPLGGLVDISPLTAKAGLGWQGHNGLLITPEFGQRQRIAPIFVQEKVFEFTDNTNHRWIENFCKSCRKCEKSCPTQAIYSEKKTSIDNVPGVGQTRTCIDRIKCFPEFNKTLGCSVCVKVCPFSIGNGQYEKIKVGFEKN